MFGKKNDPMLPAIKAVMEHNEAQRKAVEVVNEHFGITSRRALPLEKLAEYDTAVKRVLAGETLEEGYSKSAVDKEIKKDKRIKGKEAKMIHSLLKGRQKEDEPKKDLKETEQIDEATTSAIWNKYHKNEDENRHAENRILLAKHFGTDEEHEDAKALYKQHMKQGSLPYGTPLYDKVTKANDGHWEKLKQAHENEKKAAKDALKPKEPGNRTSELQSRVAKATAIAKTVKASAKKGNTYGASYSTPSGEKKTMHDDGKSEVLLKRDGDHALARVKNIVAKAKGELKNIKKQGKLFEDAREDKKIERDNLLTKIRDRRQAAKAKAANIKEEKIDEISDDLKKSYKKKAYDDIKKSIKIRDSIPTGTTDWGAAAFNKYQLRIAKRINGLSRATKNNVDFSQIHEVSKDTLKSYVSKATDRQISDGYKAKNDQDVDIDKMKKRDSKIDRAKKLIKRSHLKVVRETEQLDEGKKRLNPTEAKLVIARYNEIRDREEQAKSDANRDEHNKKLLDRLKDKKKQIDEVSKKTLASYIRQAAKDGSASAGAGEYYHHQGDGPSVRKANRRVEKRENGIDLATAKLAGDKKYHVGHPAYADSVEKSLKIKAIKEDQVVDIAALHEEIAENIMKKYNSIYEDAEQLAAFNESLCEEQRIILEKYFGPNFPNGISKPSPTLTDVARPVAAPAPLTPVAAAPLNAPSAPVAKAGMFGWGGMPKTTPPNLIKPVAPSAPTVTSPAEFAKLRQNINTQMMDRAPAPPIASPAPPVQTAATPTPTVTQAAVSTSEPSTPPVTPTTSAAKPSEPAVQSKARVRQAQAKSQRRVSAPMRPKAKYGYGSNGSGAQDAGSITNRAFGAVNEEDETPIKRSLESILRERYGN